jgi:hypothetical protein
VGKGKEKGLKGTEGGGRRKEEKGKIRVGKEEGGEVFRKLKVNPFKSIIN